MKKKKRDVMKKMFEAKEWRDTTMDEFARCGMFTVQSSPTSERLGPSVVRLIGLRKERTFKSTINKKPRLL